MERVAIGERAVAVARSQVEYGAESSLDRSPEIFQKAAINDLNTLYHRIDYAALDRAVQALADARNVVISSAWEDCSCATQLLYAALTWFHNWSFFEQYKGGSHNLMLDLGAGDALVAISTTPYDQTTLWTAWYARQARAHVVGITDAPHSPLTISAHDVLFTPVPNPGVFKSYVATTALVEMLVVMAAARSVGGDWSENSGARRHGRPRASNGSIG